MSSAPQLASPYVRTFLGAAKLFQVYILVRRTNPESLQYIGNPNYVAKRLDCKAKTADQDFVHPTFGRKQVAGLVVDPTLAGRHAFLSDQKFAAALQAWSGTAGFAATMLHPAVTTLQGQRKLNAVPGGRFYFVDLDPDSSRYGCVKFTSPSLLAAGKYIHGDFDLYGIVPAAAPALNVAVEEQRLGQKHVRSPEFFDVQHYVNGKMGAPMILHGALESYEPQHSDEGIDVFTPDGEFKSAENFAAISQLYETVFKGRQLFTKNGSRQCVRGHYMTPA